MQGESPERLSKVPGFDPLRAEIIDAPTALPVLPSDRLLPAHIRSRFAQPLAWQPEFAGDSFRVRAGIPRPASVLIPIIQRPGELQILLTQRTAHMRSHAGQIAFPGGRRDASDESAIATALREAHEEVGLHADHIEVLGVLPEYLTGTGFRITPVVALVTPPFELKLQADEVDEAFEVPLSFLMNPRHHQQRRVTSEHGERSFYAMPFRMKAASEETTAAQNQVLTEAQIAMATREYFIWGATAAMLRNLYWFLAADHV